ncbi:phenylacetic acid degradation protein [Echinicola strongylocentroti]|uniref:Phenylacetic acid degradation protein n=1 Tax=Echinicola strongylocentroti TaxID=1795355 RepID=A0A2Z4IQ06_9BACT|nr:PhoPQ-activated protein PqaA family protein [Echinicola strongylocentroti]AWW33005.1 phenylacetic acid degradation protein [Echinicola strongylocentroti]
MHQLRHSLLVMLMTGAFVVSAFAQEKNEPITHFLSSPSPEFTVELVDKITSAHQTQYELLLTSQKWKGYTWKHRLVMLVPDQVKYDQAMLYIGGGRLEDNLPKQRDRDDAVVKGLENLAVDNEAIVAAIFQVPNQPIFDGKVEDEIISYTLHQYQETGDETWPLLFPMVKSVQRAMDAVTVFSKDEIGHTLNHFLLTGLSKRGWTTWLTGSQDDRVNAIAPMVIDVLNMPVSLQYQIEMWQDYSPEIQDYVDLGIPQTSNTPEGTATISMVDPYAYREQLDMPKLVFMGTNDPYWPIDAAKNYWAEIPGDNDLVYIPNVEHGLGNGEIALQNLSAFFEYQCLQQALPQVKMDVKKSGDKHLTVSCNFDDQKPEKIVLWEASSPEDMDFRDEKWKSTTVKHDQAKLKLPKNGQKTFYLAYHFISPGGKNFYISSKVIRCDAEGIVW